MLDPRDYSTWMLLHDHPQCVAVGERVYEWYVHVNPAPPVAVQRATAARDLSTLAAACEALEREFGSIAFELTVLDDYTTVVRVRHDGFELSIYTGGQRGDSGVLTVFVERPETSDDEWRVTSVDELTRRLKALL